MFTETIPGRVQLKMQKICGVVQHMTGLVESKRIPQKPE